LPRQFRTHVAAKHCGDSAQHVAASVPSTLVEHPELVAQRITRYADLVGRERVLAGTDCGFGTFAGFGAVHPAICWAMMRTLAQGAALATKKLWAPGGDSGGCAYFHDDSGQLARLPLQWTDAVRDDPTVVVGGGAGVDVNVIRGWLGHVSLRSRSITTTCSTGQPNATARWRSAYWRWVLSVFSTTCRSVDCRT
jgi:hypothetical protein